MFDSGKSQSWNPYKLCYWDHKIHHFHSDSHPKRYQSKGQKAFSNDAIRSESRFFFISQFLAIDYNHFLSLLKGIVLPHEEKLIADCVDQMGQSNLQHDNYWIPYNWSCQLCYRMREKGAIASDPVLSYLFRELKEYRERLLKLSNFDLVPIP